MADRASGGDTYVDASSITFDYEGLFPQRAQRVSPLGVSWSMPWQPSAGATFLQAGGGGYMPWIVGGLAVALLGGVALYAIRGN